MISVSALFTHNFAYMGSRTTGNEAGNYLFVGPRWNGTVPEPWGSGCRELAQRLEAVAALDRPDVRHVLRPVQGSKDFIGYLNFLLQFSQPPHPSEVELMRRFARIGIGCSRKFR
jgi:hypothetical protein